MTDNIKELERALAAIHKSWNAEKKMVETMLSVGYMGDDDLLRQTLHKRHAFYSTAAADIRRKIEEVRSGEVAPPTEEAEPTETDKVAFTLLKSVFGDNQP